MFAAIHILTLFELHMFNTWLTYSHSLSSQLILLGICLSAWYTSGMGANIIIISYTICILSLLLFMCHSYIIAIFFAAYFVIFYRLLQPRKCHQRTAVHWFHNHQHQCYNSKIWLQPPGHFDTIKKTVGGRFSLCITPQLIQKYGEWITHMCVCECGWMMWTVDMFQTLALFTPHNTLYCIHAS